MNLYFPPFLAASDDNTIVVAVFILALFAIRTIGRGQRYRYWAETARAAIDKGQPIPPYRERRYLLQGWAYGIIWIAIGVAFYFIPGHDLRDWAPLPICVGVAMLVVGLITKRTSGDHDQQPPLS